VETPETSYAARFDTEAVFDEDYLYFYGYFEDDENRKVLREAAKALRPGGRLLIENNNLPAILRGFRDVEVIERNGDFMLDRRRFDAATNRILTERTAIKRGKARSAQFFVRSFTFPELRDWLLDAGFEEVEGYGRLGEPLTLDSWRLITIGRRAG
jgi:SAM-dependent methyltransferase